MPLTHRIQVLPEHLANKIAAGEVIQRPESVVKELLENSLDAGAKNILVVIKDGGRQLIQVVDDGTGMDEQDAVASFLRHATSKISSYEDLEAIQTYGFRGEALASIAAVAQVDMKTRRSEEDAAVVVRIDGGAEPIISREGREPGTSVTVQNLFFNVPARRKFLKSSTTEFRHIYDVVQRVALSHSELALKFISDDDTILDLRPSTLEERLTGVFGERQFEAMLRVEEGGEFLSVSGYIGKPTFGQKSRANQYLFLNRRYITNKNISHAVFSAYENLLIKGTFPFFLLFLEIDPHRVDVNVHPSKMEAKFEDEHAIYRFISTLVRKSLASSGHFPAMSVGGQAGDDLAMRFRFSDRQHSWPATGADRSSFVNPATGEILQTGPAFPRLGGTELADRLLNIEQRFGEQAGQPLPAIAPEPHSRLIWQVHNKYIISQIENGLMVVDQHVAHERVLYECALARFESDGTAGQQLLFPQTLELVPGDYALVTELLPHFEKLGFSLKPFGKNTVVVDAVPPDIGTKDAGHIIQDLLGLYREYQEHGQMDARDNLAKSYSCKAAIKAGDRLTEPEMHSLLDQLFQTKIPYVCPHGRPVVLKISIDELDKRFGRT
jgi:DNA mismatch repair protein MutL